MPEIYRIDTPKRVSNENLNRVVLGDLRIFRTPARLRHLLLEGVF